jgi:hypothetical protein
VNGITAQVDAVVRALRDLGGIGHLSEIEQQCARNGTPQPGPSIRRVVELHSARPGRPDSMTYIGKESNRLEEVEEQSLLDPSDVYTEYVDPRRDEWATKILPKLKAMPLRELMERTGLPRSTLQAIRAGRRPHRGSRTLLEKQLAP